MSVLLTVLLSISRIVLATEPSDGCCVCIYMDKGDQVPDFQERCKDNKRSARGWLEAQGCKEVKILPLSKINSISQMNQCGSVKIAYVGHAKGLHLNDFLQVCSKFSPQECTATLCAKSEACGIPEDIIGIEKDSTLIHGLLNQFQSFTVIANQTVGQPDFFTPERIDFSRECDGSDTYHETLFACAKAGDSCDADEDYYKWKGVTRHYRNYWRCLNSENAVIQQECCGATDSVSGKWAEPGVKCPTKPHRSPPHKVRLIH